MLLQNDRTMPKISSKKSLQLLPADRWIAESGANNTDLRTRGCLCNDAYCFLESIVVHFNSSFCCVDSSLVCHDGALWIKYICWHDLTFCWTDYRLPEFADDQWNLYFPALCLDSCLLSESWICSRSLRSFRWFGSDTLWYYCCWQVLMSTLVCNSVAHIHICIQIDALDTNRLLRRIRMLLRVQGYHLIDQCFKLDLAG